MTISKQQLIHEVQQLCAKHGYYYSISTGRINLMHVPDVPENSFIQHNLRSIECEII